MKMTNKWLLCTLITLFIFLSLIDIAILMFGDESFVTEEKNENINVNKESLIENCLDYICDFENRTLTMCYVKGDEIDNEINWGIQHFGVENNTNRTICKLKN